MQKLWIFLLMIKFVSYLKVGAPRFDGELLHACDQAVTGFITYASVLRVCFWQLLASPGKVSNWKS